MELRFKIKQIPQNGEPMHIHVPVPAALLTDVLEGTNGDPAHSSIDLDLDLFRERDEVIGRGRANGVLVVPCGRCVEPARVKVDAPLDLLFSRHVDERAPKEEIEEDAEALLAEPDRFRHDGDVVALEEPLRELLIAELPISPLCKPNCLGLCAVCGADRNTPEGQTCGHTAKASVEDDLLSARKLSGLANVKLQS